jgi:hypothetical protein
MGAIHNPLKTIQKITTVKKATTRSRTNELRLLGLLGMRCTCLSVNTKLLLIMDVSLYLRGKHGKITPNKSFLGNSDLVLIDLL